MDGGTEQPSRAVSGTPRAEVASALAARAAAREARAAADAEVLRGDGYLDDVLTRLHEAIGDLAEARWSTRGPEVMRAGLRVISSEQARLDAARLALIAAVDDREDVVPKAKPKTAGAAFLRTALGLERRKAAREADIARLVAGQDPDLAGVGAAYAGGDISRGHLEVAVGVHRRLGPTCRDELRPVADPDTGDVTDRRTIEAVDAVLAARARDFTVTELARIGDRLVETLNPPGPDGAHQRRYLTLSRSADGSLQGRFSCGPAQALKLLAVVAALAAPRPGKAIDADGVERDLPDQRSAPQRRIDALIEAIDHHPCTAHLLRQFIARTSGNHSAHGNDNADGGDSDGGDENAAETNDTGDGELAHHATDNPGDLAHGADRTGEHPAQSEEPPPEGEWQIRRPPGVRTGPYPDIDIIVTATLDQLAHARALAAAHSPVNQLPLDPVAGAGHDGFARAQHGGGVHPTTLALLACNARIRRVVLDEHGAVLRLGRTHRLATAAQKAALFARDVGCVIPGCDIPGDVCEVHHVAPWADGGATDIDNLVLVCPRHHVEVTEGTWEVQMVNAVPWARPPAWALPTRPLLRNASHHGAAAA